MEKKFYTHHSPFELESGDKIDKLELCYHISRKRSPGSKVIWICHALTANSNPLEWWDNLAGKGKLFDPSLHTIICVNVPGSCYGSSGPASISKDGKRYLLSFPKVTVRDVVKAQNLLREHLGIDKIDLIIGGSVGGFQALEWSILFPDIVQNCALIACNARVSPWGAAFNESQRLALLSDSSFLRQESIHGGKAGLAAARSIALLSYRTYMGYGITQMDDADSVFAERACTYQQYQGKKLCDRFDAYSYYILSYLTDSHNTGRGRGGIEKALDCIKAKTLVIGIESDMLFPFREQEELHRLIKGSALSKISSDFGHDGFLLEGESISKILLKHFSFLKLRSADFS